MKTHKFLKGRVTALLLVLCMVATLLPVTAFAEDTLITSVEITNTNFGKPSEGIEVGSPAYDAGTFNNDSAGAWTVTDVSWETTDDNGKIQAYSDGNVHLNITLTANAGYKFGNETEPGYHEWSGNATVNGEATPWSCYYYVDQNGNAQELVVSTVLPAKQTGGEQDNTLITSVELTNSNIPETITSDMKITDALRTVTCPESANYTFEGVDWYRTNVDQYTPIDNNTQLNTGDTIEMGITLTAKSGYEFKDIIKGDSVFNSFDGTVIVNGNPLNEEDFNTQVRGYQEELHIGIPFVVAQSGNPGGDEQINRYEIALDNVAAGSTLPPELGEVIWGISLNNGPFLGYELDETDNSSVTIDKGNTGGEQPKAKYSYTLDTSDYAAGTTFKFMLWITPAQGKSATVYSDNAGAMTLIGSYTEKTILEVPAGAFYRIEFTDAGGPAPGGHTDGPDTAPTADAAKLQFYDRQNNNITYEEFKRANLGTVEYSFDGNTWNEFTSEQVTSDEKLLWYTDKSDPEPANWKQIYYFSDRPVKIRVTEGALRYSPYEDGHFSFNFENNVPVECYKTSGVTYDNLYIFPQDDGVRNITWSDDAEEASQKVEHGKVIIEKAVIGEENALITDGQYSQQGNKGYVGIKGGATVTVKLIPDYGYQVGTLELNGQKLTSQDEEANYTFTMPDTNLHLRAIFEASNDEIKVAATGVTGGSIAGGEKVIDSGNLRLSVKDSTMTAEQKAQMQSSAAAKDTDILNYLEVDLEKFVNKGNSGEEWTEDLEELSEKIKITLNVGTDLDANKTYVVVREHNGVYEQIPATYDKAAGTLAFESDKFSDYALATVNENVVTELNYTDMPLYFTDGMNVTDLKPAKLAQSDAYTYFWTISKYDKDDNLVAIYVPEEHLQTAASYWGKTVDELKDGNTKFGDKFDKNYKYDFEGHAGLNDGYAFGNSVKFTATDVDGNTVTDILNDTSADRSVYWFQALEAKNAEGGNTGDTGNTGNTGATTPTEPSKPSETNPDTEADDTKSPHTGDNSNIALWFALLFVSCGGVIGTTVYSRKRKHI